MIEPREDRRACFNVTRIQSTNEAKVVIARNGEALYQEIAGLVLKGCALAAQILQSVRLQLVLQAANADLEQPGRLGAVASRQVKGPDDVAALHLAVRQPRLSHTPKGAAGAG